MKKRKLTIREIQGLDEYKTLDEKTCTGVDYKKRITPYKFMMPLIELKNFRKQVESVYSLKPLIPLACLIYIRHFDPKLVRKELDSKYFRS